MVDWKVAYLHMANGPHPDVYDAAEGLAQVMRNRTKVSNNGPKRGCPRGTGTNAADPERLCRLLPEVSISMGVPCATHELQKPSTWTGRWRWNSPVASWYCDLRSSGGARAFADWSGKLPVAELIALAPAYPLKAYWLQRRPVGHRETAVGIVPSSRNGRAMQYAVPAHSR